MSPDWRRAAGGYLRFLAGLVLICGGLVSVGYIPTARVAGEGAAAAMFAACALSLIGSGAGGLAVAAAAAKAIEPGPGPTLAAMAIRLGVVAGGATLATLAGAFEARAFLVWVAVSYLALLPADVRYALTTTTERPEPRPEPST